MMQTWKIKCHCEGVTCPPHVSCRHGRRERPKQSDIQRCKDEIASLTAFARNDTGWNVKSITSFAAYLSILLASLLILPRVVFAQAQNVDSMASFKSLIEFSKLEMADIGGMVAPEILNVSHFPTYPKPGEKVLVRATVKIYSSMVSYKVTNVELSYSIKHTAKKGQDAEEQNKIAMTLEDADAGIYSAVIPETLKDGDEVFYAVRAQDDWGNVAVELILGSSLQIVMEDREDAGLIPFMDVRKLEAALLDADKLKLCLQLREQPKRPASNTSAFAIMILGNDVRYKPDQTESELQSGWLAAYLPVAQVRDILPTSELFNIEALMAGGGKKKEKRAEFENIKEENKLCYTFNPSVIRADAYNGLKLAGATLSFNISPMAIKPQDSTHIVMVYPGSHSFKVK